jgi:catechol-2,3-dioxygenase
VGIAVKGNPGESNQAQFLPKEKEAVRGAPNLLGVRHVGLAAKDPASLAAFYHDVMGMKIVRQAPSDSPLGAIAFVARHPEEEDHDIVFISNAAAAHTAFRVASLGDLLALYRRIKEREVPIKQCLNHAVEFAFYFEDPEGHLIEIYWVMDCSTSPTFMQNRLILKRLRSNCAERLTAWRRISASNRRTETRSARASTGIGLDLQPRSWEIKSWLRK